MGAEVATDLTTGKDIPRAASAPEVSNRNINPASAEEAVKTDPTSFEKQLDDYRQDLAKIRPRMSDAEIDAEIAKQRESFGKNGIASPEVIYPKKKSFPGGSNPAPKDFNPFKGKPASPESQARVAAAQEKPTSKAVPTHTELGKAARERLRRALETRNR